MNPSDSPQDASRPAATLRLVALLGLGLGAAYIIGVLLWPFLPALVTSAVLAALFHPAQRRIRRRVRNDAAAAFAGTTIVFFLILLPIVALSFVLAREIVANLDWVGEGAVDALAPHGRISGMIQSLAARLGIDAVRVRAAAQEQIDLLTGSLAGRTLGLISGLGGWLLQAGVALFTLYYLLRDGDRVVAAITWLLPLRAEDTEHLVARALEVTHATVYGNVAVAVAQGTLGGLAFWAVGLPNAALWGTVMGVLALLPAIGAFLVWMPAGIFLMIDGEILRGIILLAFGALVISTIDNLLRTILVSGRAQLHPLIVFFSVLGGLVVFGATGIFIGPVLFVLSIAVLEMARLALEPDTEARNALRAALPLATRQTGRQQQHPPWWRVRETRRAGRRAPGSTSDHDAR